MSWIRRGEGKNGRIDASNIIICLKTYESRLIIISFVFVGLARNKKHKQSRSRSRILRRRGACEVKKLLLTIYYMPKGKMGFEAVVG